MFLIAPARQIARAITTPAEAGSFELRVMHWMKPSAVGTYPSPSHIPASLNGASRKLCVDDRSASGRLGASQSCTRATDSSDTSVTASLTHARAHAETSRYAQPGPP